MFHDSDKQSLYVKSVEFELYTEVKGSNKNKNFVECTNFVLSI